MEGMQELVRCANPKCGKEFEKIHYNKKCCSLDCNTIYQNNKTAIQNGTFGLVENRRCQNPKCNNHFEFKLSHPHRKWCSEKCRRNFSQNKISKENREFLTRGKYYHCPVCNNDFEPFCRINQRCCSDKCSKKYYALKHCKAPATKTVSCKCCGRFFQKTNKMTRQYCSVKCRNRYHRKPRQLTEKEIAYRKAYKKTEKSKQRAREYREDHRYRDQIYGIRKYYDNRINLKDPYVKALLVQDKGISAKEVPKELIELKRTHLKLKRKIYGKARKGSSESVRKSAQ